MLKKLSLFILYLCFAVVLTAVLLVVRFPQDNFLSFVESKIEQKMVGYSCEILEPEYRYPFSLHFGKITFTQKKEHLVFPLGDMLITVDPQTVLKQCHVRFDVFGGSVVSDVSFDRNSGAFEFLDLSVSGMDMAKIELFQHRFDRNVSGMFKFTGTFGGSLQNLEKGRLVGALEIVNFQTELKRPVLMSSSVEFDSVNMLVRFQDRKLALGEGDAKGRMYDADFLGNMEIGKGWRGATIDITGNLSPRQEYIRKNRQVARAAALLYKKYKNTRIPYRISGSLREPAFQYGRL